MDGFGDFAAAPLPASPPALPPLDAAIKPGMFAPAALGLDARLAREDPPLYGVSLISAVSSGGDAIARALAGLEAALGLGSDTTLSPASLSVTQRSEVGRRVKLLGEVLTQGLVMLDGVPRSPDSTALRRDEVRRFTALADTVDVLAAVLASLPPPAEAGKQRGGGGGSRPQPVASTQQTEDPFAAFAAAPAPRAQPVRRAAAPAPPPPADDDDDFGDFAAPAAPVAAVDDDFGDFSAAAPAAAPAVRAPAPAPAPVRSLHLPFAPAPARVAMDDAFAAFGAAPAAFQSNADDSFGDFSVAAPVSAPAAPPPSFAPLRAAASTVVPAAFAPARALAPVAAPAKHPGDEDEDGFGSFAAAAPPPPPPPAQEEEDDFGSFAAAAPAPVQPQQIQQPLPPVVTLSIDDAFGALVDIGTVPEAPPLLPVAPPTALAPALSTAAPVAAAAEEDDFGDFAAPVPQPTPLAPPLASPLPPVVAALAALSPLPSPPAVALAFSPAPPAPAQSDDDFGDFSGHTAPPPLPTNAEDEDDFGDFAAQPVPIVAPLPVASPPPVVATPAPVHVDASTLARMLAHATALLLQVAAAVEAARPELASTAGVTDPAAALAAACAASPALSRRWAGAAAVCACGCRVLLAALCSGTGSAALKEACLGFMDAGSALAQALDEAGVSGSDHGGLSSPLRELAAMAGYLASKRSSLNPRDVGRGWTAGGGAACKLCRGIDGDAHASWLTPLLAAITGATGGRDPHAGCAALEAASRPSNPFE